MIRFRVVFLSFLLFIFLILSIVSRSIVYILFTSLLILSLFIAAGFLKKGTGAKEKRFSRQGVLYYLFIAGGILLFSYGFAGAFSTQSMFHYLGTAPSDEVVIAGCMITGSCLFTAGVTGKMVDFLR
ncbi:MULTISPECIES: hypothetical protein [Alteribacter]|uniref:Uncharacterized protein n=1 Tax=Alteribacter keqinensis TaxID=2483800 RepID=A0A3M7TU90_9BACI|nr:MULTISPECIES: hypothetical protein [Alteribacter]MBM7094572.1 hypothetical protein [Alteribacter salitolerans]RNA69216.1 hypothetical protein EBO34_04515 [Alteribacter keqinensis]